MSRDLRLHKTKILCLKNENSYDSSYTKKYIEFIIFYSMQFEYIHSQRLLGRNPKGYEDFSNEALLIAGDLFLEAANDIDAFYGYERI